MCRRLRCALTAACLLWTALSPVALGQILLDDYTSGLSPKWTEKSFAGHTEYRVVRDEGRLCLRARSRASASALYYEIRFDPRRYPVIEWWWKIESILERGDALTRAGDDYPARLYVVFSSRWFWKTRAVNYIWANKIPRGTAVPNPFTPNSVMIAVQSGPRNAGQWRRERRNVLQDYRRYFGEDPPLAGAVALMTDTDNTGSAATAYYGPIQLLPASRK